VASFFRSTGSAERFRGAHARPACLMAPQLIGRRPGYSTKIWWWIVIEPINRKPNVPREGRSQRAVSCPILRRRSRRPGITAARRCNFAVSLNGAALSLVAIQLSPRISSDDGPISLLPSPFGARDQDRRAAPLRFYHCSPELHLNPAEAVPLRVGAEDFPPNGLRECAGHVGEFTSTAC
jgi:hypothetical protein